MARLQGLTEGHRTEGWAWKFLSSAFHPGEGNIRPCAGSDPNKVHCQQEQDLEEEPKGGSLERTALGQPGSKGGAQAQLWAGPRSHPHPHLFPSSTQRCADFLAGGLQLRTFLTGGFKNPDKKAAVI